MSYYDISEVPDGWSISTNTEKHISLIHSTGDGKSIGLVPKSDPEYDRWIVKGYTGFTDYPVFARNLSVSEAIDKATTVAKDIARGGSPSRIETIEANENNISSSTSSTDDVVSGDDNDSNESKSNKDDQVDLTDFIN